MVSCSTPIKHKGAAFEWPRQSFVKVQHEVFSMTCSPADPNDIYSKCYESQITGEGSGAIVGRSKSGSYIITAGHVCSKEGVEPRMNVPVYPIDETSKRAFFVYDLDYNKHHAEVLAYEDHEDLCVLHVWGYIGEPLKLSRKSPAPGDLVYNIAAPGGLFQREMVPLLEGRYCGEYNHYEHGTKSLYTVPVMAGSSGSPILN